MVKKLLFVLKSGRIRLARIQKARGLEAPPTHEARSAFLTGGSVVSCTSCQQLPDYRPPVQRAFCFDDTPNINAKPRQGGNLPGRGIVWKGHTMQPDSTSDPDSRKVKKAQEYLRRLQTYFESRHVLIHDTWTDFSVGDRTEVEVTTRNLNVCKAIRYAVRVLGGRMSFPRVQHRVFIRGDQVERHKVLVFRFKF